MKKVLMLVMLYVCFMPFSVNAQRGCCSSHGGVVGCNQDGRQICSDGTLSPSCTCTPSKIEGCTDVNAKNYNVNANSDNGSCVYYNYGCTNKDALNYDVSAEKDDGSCIIKVYGCMDNTATNYNPEANISDDSCEYKEKSGVINNTGKLVNEAEITAEENNDSASEVGVAIILCSGIGFAVYKGTKNNKKLKVNK